MAELNQAVTIITSSTFPNAKAIRTNLTRLNVKLQGISRDLDQAARTNVSETIDKLEVALERLYELALFIRGDYDNREPDEISKGNLFHQLRQEFEEVEARAHRGLKEIGDLHNQVMEIQSMAITPIKNTLSLMTQNNRDELAITLSRISSTQQSIQTFDRIIRRQEDAVRTLESKMESTEAAYTASAIMFHFLTFGIGTLINRGPLDPFNLRSDLDHAARARNDAQNQRNRMLNEISNLRNEKQRLQQRLKEGQQLAAELSLLSNTAVSSESRCITIQSGFGTLKDAASRLVSQVKGVVGDIDVVERMAYTKKEFALLLLGLCGDALVDLRLAKGVQKIKDELVEGYGSSMPKEIEEAWNELEGKMALSQARITGF